MFKLPSGLTASGAARSRSSSGYLLRIALTAAPIESVHQTRVEQLTCIESVRLFLAGLYGRVSEEWTEAPVSDDELIVRPARSVRRSRYQGRSGEVSDLLVGGQWEWAWGLNGTLRAVSSPGSDGAVPAVPKSSDPHEQSLGYWAILHYLLRYRLGRENPHIGLYRWSESGRQADDLTLQFVDAM